MEQKTDLNVKSINNMSIFSQYGFVTLYSGRLRLSGFRKWNNRVIEKLDVQKRD